MIIRNEAGRIGEEAAADFLKKKGYRILERNWQWHHWEVDIIAENKDTVAFVEVKTRSSAFGGKQPEEYVDEEKKRNTARCADKYISLHHIEKTPRLDIVSVLLEPPTLTIREIRHLPDAYGSPMRTVGGLGKRKPVRKRTL